MQLLAVLSTGACGTEVAVCGFEEARRGASPQKVGVAILRIIITGGDVMANSLW